MSTGDDWDEWWPSTAATRQTGPVRLVTGTGTTAYGREALARECDRVREAGQGQRNHTLNTAAYRIGQLVGAHELSLDDGRAGLWEAGLASGLPEREVALCLRTDTTGGLVKGQEQPRSVEAQADHTEGLRGFLDDDLVPPGGGGGGGGPTDGGEGDGENQDAERSSWFPRDLGPILRGEVEPVVPEFLRRNDGRALFYPGKVNGLIGPSESGKSWLLFLAIAQVLTAPQGVCLLLDFEDDAAGAVERLRALGVPDEAIEARFAYADPDQALDALARRDLAETLRDRGPVLIGVDGVNAAMSLFGFKPESNADATAFSSAFLKPLTKHGAAVGTVDHVTKNAGPEGRAAGAIGAQAKRAMTDGATIAVEVVEPFGRGMTGRLRLTVDKDRRGVVRGLAVGARVVGEAVLRSTDGGAKVDLVIEAATEETAAVEVLDPRRESLLWEQISRAVEDVEANGEPPNGNAVAALLRSSTSGGRSKADVVDALAGMVASGYLSRNGHANRGYRYRVIRRFRERPAGFEEGDLDALDSGGSGGSGGSENHDTPVELSRSGGSGYRAPEAPGQRTTRTDDGVPPENLPGL